MPFAAIMATTAAASRASAGSLSPLAIPLLALALTQTVVLALAGGWAVLLKYRPFNLTWPSRAKDHWPIGGKYGFVSASLGPRHARFGLFTIPIGLAVISIGLISLHISTVGAIAALSAASLVTVIEMAVIPLGRWLYHPKSSNTIDNRIAISSEASDKLIPRDAKAGLNDEPRDNERSTPTTEPDETAHRANGKWFLAPAALLSIALGLSTIAKRALKSAHPEVATLAFLLWLLGVLGYLYLLAISTLRITRSGLPRRPLSSWWIVAGCGGLAAGTGGSLLTTSLHTAPNVNHIDAIRWLGINSILIRISTDTSIGIWCIASLIMIPILLVSSVWIGKKILNTSQSLIISLLGKMRIAAIPNDFNHPNHLNHSSEIDLASNSPDEQYEPPPWPPTFSMGVYALGTSIIGHITMSSGIRGLGKVADIATLSLWLMSTAIAVIRWSPALNSYKYRYYRYRNCGYRQE